MASTKGRGKKAKDPYDLLIEQAEGKGASKPKNRRGKDPYDELLMSAEKARPDEKAKPAPRRKAKDPYDEFSANSEKAKPNQRRKGKDSYDEFSATSEKAKPTPRRKMKDPYDDFLMTSEKTRPVKPESDDEFWGTPVKKSKGGRGKKKGGGGYAAFVLSALIVLCALASGWQMYRYSRFIAMRNAVERATFFEGSTVEGVDISEMSLTDAVEYWSAQIEPGYYGRAAYLDNGVTVMSSDVGYSSDYRQVLESAWGAQKSGTLEQRYASLVSVSSGAPNRKVTRTLYTEEAISALVSEIAGNTDVEARNASVTGFDSANYAFTFSEGVTGKALNKDKLASDIKSALDAGGGSVSLDIATIEPTVRAADIKDNYGLRASAVTNASSSSANRLTNVSLALKSINGTVLQPGDEFSFNDTVGQRTADRGYKMAAAFSGGEVTEELGGGICQVSTTLFNAAVKADLEITERHPHSMPVSYVDKGKDATVNWGSQDMKFKNTSDAPVYIAAYLSNEKRVRIGIFGLAIAKGEYITVEAEVTETTKFETTYQVNAFLMPGETSELQKGRNGYKAVAYKLRWASDGTLVNKEVLCNSTYAKRDAIIEVAQ